MDKMPNGTLIQKMKRQPNCSIKSPPKAGPIIVPATTTAPIVPYALPLFPWGNVFATIPITFPIIIAPPIPWTAREAINIKRLVANALSTDPRIKTATPHMKNFFLPFSSDNFPMNGRIPVMINK